MFTLILRSAILVLVGLLTWGIAWSGRRYVERRRRIALAAQPVFEAANSNMPGNSISRLARRRCISWCSAAPIVTSATGTRSRPCSV